MKRISKTVLSIFMCTIFSALTFFTASAVLSPEMEAQADAFYQQHCEFAPGRHPNIKGLREWKLRVLGYVRLIDNTSEDKILVSEFLLNLASKLTGNKGLEGIKIHACQVTYSPDMGHTGAIIFDFITTLGQISRIII